MPIRVTCKNCGSKINARDDLLGQTRICPKCREPLLIEPDVRPVEVETIVPAATHPLQEKPLPFKLDWTSRYVILAAERVIAFLESGQGWMLSIGNGFVPAKRNFDAIPDQGTFALVEIFLEDTPEGQRFSGLNIFQITARGALLALTQNEESILGRIDAPAPLLKPQKTALLLHLRQHYMFDFLAHSQPVVDFLLNEDISSTHIGRVEPEQTLPESPGPG